MTDLNDIYQHASQWAFGDSPEMADQLLALVMAGEKTASCGSYDSYRAELSPMVGDYHIVLDGRGKPGCAIRTLSLRLIRYRDVTADMAAKEGEGDKSLNYWQQAHREFFERNSGFSQDMWLIYEEFEVVAVF
ncbi:ASCH domain-containing protein [Biostraticola tofi]|uniref:Uncharacterized protein YhfF n=1 Tax=Biostraticola tofi TaxID=466109 RepID=A0A4R3YYJ6_9GAMM|nr:ASCH domain-containing protein [Biostraticola tofi]TCV96574.1 uncharacterized protein YhfF [Biostraticola tofi]